MNENVKVLSVGFDKEIEEKIQFYSNNIDLFFIPGNFENLERITHGDKRLAEYNQILLAPNGKTYFPELIDFYPKGSDEKNSYVYLEDNKLTLNDYLIFERLGFRDFIFDTRYRNSESIITLFLPELNNTDCDIQRLFLKLKNAIESANANNSKNTIHLTGSERKYLGTLALYSFLDAFISMDKYSIILPESHHPDKYYLNCDIIELERSYNSYSDFNNFRLTADIGAEFKSKLESWNHENDLNLKQNKTAPGNMAIKTKTAQKSFSELKMEFIDSLKINKAETYRRYNIIDISFNSFYDIPNHHKINDDLKNFSNPFRVFPKYSDINDALYTIFPTVYPITHEKDFSYTIEEKTYKHIENEWPPKTDVFLNKIKNEFNVHRAESGKSIFIGNSKNLTYWANKIAVATRTEKGHIIISGETGSGKEFTAEILHFFSFWYDDSLNSYIAVNCADIPDNLADSILFGHVKGAFTGAAGSKNGIIFSKQRGTVFLDEINQLPRETLGKLLRFMETGEFIKLGDSRVSSSDVRIVAATNSQDFLNDEFLNSTGIINRFMFHVNIPALRYRIDDIPVLAEYFWNKAVEEYCGKFDRIIPDTDSLTSLLNSRKENIIHELSSKLWINSNVRGLKNEVNNIINRFIAIEELKFPVEKKPPSVYAGKHKHPITYISDEEFIRILREAKHRSKNGIQLCQILKRESCGGYTSRSSVRMKLSRMKNSGLISEAKAFQKEFTKTGFFKDYPDS
jgi:transcriptional regulator with AAA-type ATPase domain